MLFEVNCRLRLLGLSAALLYRSAMAADSLIDDNRYPDYAFRGFGTLGAVYHNNDDVKFRRDIGQAGGAKADRISFAQDSMLGAQLTLFLHDRVEVTAQGISRLTTENNFEPTLTWGYLKYQPAEELNLRVGRLGVETYIQGDSAEIGYANLQIRQPIIFYPRTFDGVDAEFNQPLAQGTLRVKGFAGWAQGELIGFGEPYDTGGSEIFGGGIEYSRHGWTGRVSIGQITLRDEVNELKPGTPSRAALQMLPNGRQLLDKLEMQNRAINYKSLALAYDSGPIQGIASYNLVESHDWPEHHLFYANLGYHLDKLMPYIAYSNQWSDRVFVGSGMADGIGFDTLNRTAELLETNAMINQNNFAVGLRYDFIDNMALKFQVDHIRYRDPESIVDPGLQAENARTRDFRSVTVFSLALDFVF